MTLPVPVPATSARVMCAGQRHRLLWRDGELVAADHPDPERERALTALGGDTYRCLQLLQVWDEHTDDLDVLVLAPRGPTDTVAVDDDDTAHGHHGGAVHHGAYRSSGWYAYSSTLSVTNDGHRHARGPGLSDLLRLGGHLPDRLAHEVVASWSQRLAAGTADTARPRLQAALYGRVAAAVRDWLGEPRARCELEMIGPGAAGSVERGGDVLQVRLPFSWLSDVWSPGLTVVSDLLVLTARRTHPKRVELTGLDHDLVEHVLTLERS